MRNVKPVVYAAAFLALLVITSGCAISGKHEIKPPSPDRQGTVKVIKPSVPDQKRIKRYEVELSKLAALARQLQESNSLLAAEISDLKRSNARYKSLLDLQDRVLELLDDKNNTVRTMLTEEAKKLNLTTDYPEGERTYCSYSESDLFDRGATVINAKGRKMLTGQWDELKTGNVKSIVIESNPCDVINEPAKFPTAESRLSAARATAVAAFFSSRMNHTAGKVSFGTAVSLRPDLPESDTEENRESRIDVVFELVE